MTHDGDIHTVLRHNDNENRAEAQRPQWGRGPQWGHRTFQSYQPEQRWNTNSPASLMFTGTCPCSRSSVDGFLTITPCVVCTPLLSPCCLESLPLEDEYGGRRGATGNNKFTKRSSPPHLTSRYNFRMQQSISEHAIRRSLVCEVCNNSGTCWGSSPVHDKPPTASAADW